MYHRDAQNLDLKPECVRVAHTTNPNAQEARAEDYVFESILAFFVRLVSKNKMQMKLSKIQVKFQ